LNKLSHFYKYNQGEDDFDIYDDVIPQNNGAVPAGLKILVNIS
jgi:hypothetical protein